MNAAETKSRWAKRKVAAAPVKIPAAQRGIDAAVCLSAGQVATLSSL
jgi:hypothetical protein